MTKQAAAEAFKLQSVKTCEDRIPCISRRLLCVLFAAGVVSPAWKRGDLARSQSWKDAFCSFSPQLIENSHSIHHCSNSNQMLFPWSISIHDIMIYVSHIISQNSGESIGKFIGFQKTSKSRWFYKWRQGRKTFAVEAGSPGSPWVWVVFHVAALKTNYGLLLLMAEILHQLNGSVSDYLQSFIHPKWCRISSINRTIDLFWPLIS